MTDVLLIVAAVVALVCVLIVFAKRQISRMTLGTFHIDDSGKASFNGVFEFERMPEDIWNRHWIIMRVEKTDLSLPNERNRRNDSSYYGGFNNQEERGKANER